MANGQPFDPAALTVACNSYSFGTRLLIHCVPTGREVVVEVTDRLGPAAIAKGRELDLSEAAFIALANPDWGVVEVRYSVFGNLCSAPLAWGDSCNCPEVESQATPQADSSLQRSGPGMAVGSNGRGRKGDASKENSSTAIHLTAAVGSRECVGGNAIVSLVAGRGGVSICSVSVETKLTSDMRESTKLAGPQGKSPATLAAEQFIFGPTQNRAVTTTVIGAMPTSGWKARTVYQGTP
jgi:hypothetical protein